MPFCREKERSLLSRINPPSLLPLLGNAYSPPRAGRLIRDERFYSNALIIRLLGSLFSLPKVQSESYKHHGMLSTDLQI